MLMLDANAILECMPFPMLVEKLAELHREPVGLVDEMLMETTDADNNVNHFFVRGGWQPEKAVGAKVITIFPRNNRARDWPSIQAVYILFEAVNGTPVACLDGTALTWVKTASDSALGSKLLSRPEIESMLMIGAGQMAVHLVRAHCQVRPSLQNVHIWNRTLSKAQSLARELSGQFPDIRFEATPDLEASARGADLICSAIASTEPVIHGEWLKPGTHVDLVGAYTMEMREADDECLRRGSLFVDARATTVKQIGELALPLANAVIGEEDVLAELGDLCLERHPGRQDDDEITIFKNGGGGHLDLMCARLLHEHAQKN